MTPRGAHGGKAAERTTLQDRLRRGRHGPLGVVLFVVATVLAACGVEPLATWYYVAAWYPLLLAVDAAAARRRGRSLLSERPLALLCLACWSVPFWLLFEALNLRLENWYYVLAPEGLLESRLLLLLAFATVLPAIFVFADLLEAYGFFERVRWPALPATPRLRNGLALAGLAMLVLTLAFPRACYPLAWGFLALLLEPFNYRPRWPSLLRDLEGGRPARLLRLLFGGLLCGLVWEFLNLPARARWIYTVPLFDETFAVEMPPIGFLGFPPFALEAYVFVRALEILGLSAPAEADAWGRALPLRAGLRLFALPVAVAAFSMLAIVGLERRTVDSRDAPVAELSLATRREAAALGLIGIDRVRELARAGQDGLPDAPAIARHLAVQDAHAEALVEQARLAELRGLGPRNAALLERVGITTVPSLARARPDELYERLRALGPPADSVRPQRVRVWIRGARERGE